MQESKSKTLTKLKSNIGDLRILVKCPICLKILKDPVELKCSHLFCKSCIQPISKGNSYLCPVCQKSAIKKSAKPAHELDGVLKFLQEILSERNSDGKSKLSSKVTKTALKPEEKEEKEKASTRKKSTRKKRYATDKPMSPPKTAADVAIATKQKKYENYVKDWLTNTDNLFFRTSQTQQLTCPESPGKKHPKDLVSISQQRNRRTLPSTWAARSNTYERKYKSLNLVNTSSYNSKMGKIDISKFDTPFDYETTIENVNTVPLMTKTQILKLLEEKCLQEIDINSETCMEKQSDDSDLLEKQNPVAKVKRGRNKLDITKGIAKKLKRSPAKDVGHETSDEDKTKRKKRKVLVENTNLSKENTEMANNKKKVKKLEKETPKKVEKDILKKTKASPSPKHKSIGTIVALDKYAGENESQAVDKNNESVKTTTEVQTQNNNRETSSIPVVLNIPKIEELSLKLNSFLSKFHELNSEFCDFIKLNPSDKVSLVHENLVQLEPKLSSMCDILSINHSPRSSMNVIIHRETQTDLDLRQYSNISIQTSPVKTSEKSKEVKELIDQGVQTADLGVTLKFVEDKELRDVEDKEQRDIEDKEQKNVEHTQPKVVENKKSKDIEPEMKNMEFGDSFDIETQAYDRIINNDKETMIMKNVPVLTEGMALTEIMNELQANKTHNTGWFDCNDDDDEESEAIVIDNEETPIVLPQISSDNEDTDLNVIETEKTPIVHQVSSNSHVSCRKKLYDSPSSPMTVTLNTKKVKPLAISDSEDESHKPIINKFIREDVSLCFDSESQSDMRVMNTPNVDKYLDDVWQRIQADLETSTKTTESSPIPENVKSSIKTHEIIAKYEKIITANPTQSLKKPELKQTEFAKNSTENNQVEDNAKNSKATGPSKTNLTCDNIIESNEDFEFEDFATPTQDFCNLHNTIVEKPRENSEIQILQDIQVCPAPSTPLSDEDVIFSTPESSPQKSRPDLSNLNLPESIPLLAPPPDFQDIEPIPSTSCRLSQSTPGLSPISKSTTCARFSTRKRVTSTPFNRTRKLTQTPITPFVRKASSTVKHCFSEEDEDDLFLQKRVVVSTTRLDKPQLLAVTTLTNRSLAKYSSGFDSTVTHLVVATNSSNCIKDHTIKFIRAVAAGIWVVNFKWVQDCLAQNKLIPEEEYEVLDVTGIDGPRQSRLHRCTNPLFAGFKMFAAPPFVLSTPMEIQSIIRSLGGMTVPTPEDLLRKDGLICVIVTETVSSQDVTLYEKYQDWLEKYRVVTVDVEWLTRSIGQYKVMSLRRFTLCPDESICDLDYPSELIQEVTFSSPTQY